MASAIAVVLLRRRASEFTAPNDQRVVKQTTQFQIGDQSGDRFIGGVAVGGQFGFQTVVLIPSLMGDFDKPDAGFGQTTGHQTLTTEIFGRFFAQSVQGFHLLGFLIDIHHGRHRVLHFEGQFIRLDHAFDLRIDFSPTQGFVVERLNQIQLFPLIRAGQGRVFNITNRGGSDIDSSSLIGRGQKGRTIILRSAQAVQRVQGHETRQVFVFRSQTVQHPGTHGRTHQVNRSCMQKNGRLRMGRHAGMHPVEQT